MTFVKNWVLPILLICHCPVFAWNLSKQSFERKIQAETPTWMSDSIQSEFASFRKGFSKADVLKCIERLKQMQGIEVAGLVHVEVSPGKSSYKPLFPLSPEQQSHCKGFMSALLKLDQLSPLPTIEFLISFNRTFDRPLLVKETFVPIFAISKEKHNRKVVLVPRLWDTNREMKFDVFCDWAQKTEKALWRGSTTDGFYEFYDWDTWPRTRMVLHSQHHPDLLDASFITSSLLNTFMTNWMQGLNFYSDPIDPKDQASYKYLLSLDGKSSPSSFEWQLFSGSVILKTHSNKIEWFYPGLTQDEHYITIHANGDDLIKRIVWLKSNDKKAKMIAEKGLLFAQQHLLDEEIFTYLYHVLQYYDALYTN